MTGTDAILVNSSRIASGCVIKTFEKSLFLMTETLIG